MDATNCEIARFLTVTPTTVETVSCFVPRKVKFFKFLILFFFSKKSTHLFQEDLYLNVPSGEPSLSANEWFNKKNAQRKYQTLRPSSFFKIKSILI